MKPTLPNPFLQKEDEPFQLDDEAFIEALMHSIVPADDSDHAADIAPDISPSELDMSDLEELAGLAEEPKPESEVQQPAYFTPSTILQTLHRQLHPQSREQDPDPSGSGK